MITWIILWFRWLVIVEETRQNVSISGSSHKLLAMRFLYVDQFGNCFDYARAVIREIISGFKSANTVPCHLVKPAIRVLLLRVTTERRTCSFHLVHKIQGHI